MLFTHLSPKIPVSLNRDIWRRGDAYSPEHKVMGVNILTILRLQKVSRVTHYGTPSARGSASLLQWIPIPGNELKQFLQSSINVLRSFLPLQFLLGRKIIPGYQYR